MKTLPPFPIAAVAPVTARFCAAALVLLGVGGCGTVTRIPPTPEPQATIIFRQMDKNHDGKLTREEFNAGFADAVFGVYNQPRTGSITIEQWNRIQNANNPTGRSSFEELDLNHDGKLTYTELSSGPGRDAVVNRFFNLIDKNRDGTISVDEGRPAGLDRTPQQRAGGEGL